MGRSNSSKCQFYCTFVENRLGLLFIDGSHTEISAINDYNNWSSKLHSNGALVIHDIYEKPEDGGQAPYLIYQKALTEGFQLHERVDTIVCLTQA